MAELNTNFTKEDIETLIEAMGDWEYQSSQDYILLNMLKKMPMPTEDHASHAFMQDLRQQYLDREREILRNRDVQQEKAVLLKAKLILARQDASINRLFDMAAAVSPTSSNHVPQNEQNENVEQLKSRLSLAEEFIKDMMIWSHFEKFVAEKTS